MSEDRVQEIKELRLKRLEICNSCEFFRKEDTGCLMCGCIMSVKTNLPDTKCPIGKW